MSRIKNLRDEALEFHKIGPGKIEVRVTCPAKDKDDLTLAYSPGVAEPVKEIAADLDNLDVYTNHANAVCVVSNGTAILGLGNLGAAAAMPVMEGKALLFKAFGDVDAYPICVDTTDTAKIVELVELIAPSFGGVNLEDIKAPECFVIEDTLKANGKFKGAIFHDDQHGTAVVTLAGLFNALKVVGKKIEDVKVVANGAGAAGIAIIKLLMHMGLKNVIMCDTKGAIYKGRAEGMNKYKDEIAERTNVNLVKGDLKEAIKGADVFIGISAPEMLDEEMIKSMAPNPIIFAQANPIPEIWPIQRALDAGAAVIATGRSDVQNQVNNVLAFPGIFRGAIDVRATDINDAMKVAAAKAIADCVKPEELNANYIIPSSFNPEVAPAVAAATAQAAIDSGIARNPIDPASIAENLKKRMANQYKNKF
ncbi:Malate dehydrogenase (oxaloacetate-decarboxylating) (NADP(+)) [Syntrophobotulus glycolicus DSM 8271]|uniref:Malate dehydrogenase (Oxaloacetate-decarboxylating) (NADP(+)) n=1 Tax=Syntrophobotulus glycolicus (strain DSM 8271 / FlGlyR) TaxID=645991 RepID=F0T2T0_SYNGF|nr:malic enzyme-like NAD(P)-binding protein [Syntrophobotulus glycolicus]ADY56479.1 Malate dehydrogenase (oxaloacetate-decarboxylating) (NADP(+)) [Syntrophobotulus glycolicus DSM 8271]